MAKVREQTALMREQRLRAELTARLGRPPTAHELLTRATGGPPTAGLGMAVQEPLAAPSAAAAGAAAAAAAAVAAAGAAAAGVAAGAAAGAAAAPPMAGLDPARERRLRAELTYRLGRPPTPTELEARATGRVPPRTTGAGVRPASAAPAAMRGLAGGLDPARERRLRAELTYRLGRPPTPTELEARATGRVGPLAPRAKAAEAQQAVQGYQGQYQAHRPCAPSKGIWKVAPPTAAAARRPPPPSQWKAAAPKPVVFRGAQAQVMRF
jgi:hypothetical protein